MTPKQRVRIAMSGGVPDRVPVVPQIRHPHAIRMLALPFRETLLQTLRGPLPKNQLTLCRALAYGVDGIRAFRVGEPARVVARANVKKRTRSRLCSEARESPRVELGASGGCSGGLL